MKKETTLAPRTWHSRPPPHVGWWHTECDTLGKFWRWWNGDRWSISLRECDNARTAHIAAHTTEPWGQRTIRWTDYWPKDARVPRVDPAHPYITPMLPKMNAGDGFAWFQAGHRMRALQHGKEWAKWALTREPISMPTPDPDLCVPKIDMATCTSLEMPKVREVAPTPEEDEAWRAVSTGQRAGPAAQNPGARDLGNVPTRDLMTELFRRVG